MSDGDDPCIGRPDDVPLSEFVEELRGKAPPPRDEARPLDDAFTDLVPYVRHDTNCAWLRGDDEGCTCGAGRALDAFRFAYMAAAVAAAPRADTNEIERDRMWCKALIESGLSPMQIEKVTGKFNHLRSAARAPGREPDGK